MLLDVITTSEINPMLDALAENLRYFQSLRGKMLSFDLQSGQSNSLRKTTRFELQGR